MKDDDDQRSDFITPTDDLPPDLDSLRKPVHSPPAEPTAPLPVVSATLLSPDQGRVVDSITIKLVDNAEKINGRDKGMFDRIREMFGDEDSDVYGSYSIQTSNCSVCRAARAGKESTPGSEDFRIYGALSVNDSPGRSSDGSFCPVCQTREEHELAHDSAAKIEYNDALAL